MNQTSMRISRVALTAAILVSAAACADLTGSRSSGINTAALTAALSTVPAGYGDLSSSYVGTATADVNTGEFPMGGGPDARFNRGGLMGGGLHEEFLGAVGWGFGAHRGDRGPFGFGIHCAGTFDATSGRVTCPTLTGHGLTLTRSFKFTDASGTAQQAFDTMTTNSVNAQTAVSGTLTFSADSGHEEMGEHHRGWGMGRGAIGRLLGDTATVVSATTTIDNKSDRTVAGLAAGSTSRTVNGTSQGSETTKGTSTKGDFTATRTAYDTTSGIVIAVPSSTSGPTYPTAGSVIRSMSVTLTFGSQTVSVSRREKVTYDGSATAKIEITENGTTKNCTKPLPFGPMTCQ